MTKKNRQKLNRINTISFVLIIGGILLMAYLGWISVEQYTLSKIWRILPGIIFILSGFFMKCKNSISFPDLEKRSVLTVRCEGAVFVILLLVPFILLGIWIVREAVREGALIGYLVMELGTMILVWSICYYVLKWENFRMFIMENGKIIIISPFGKKTYFYMRDIERVLYKNKRMNKRMIFYGNHKKVLLKVDISEYYWVNTAELEEYLKSKKIKVQRYRSIWDRNHYNDTNTGIWEWNKKENTWQNDHAKEIEKGIKILSLLLFAGIYIYTCYIVSDINMRYAYIGFALFSVPLYIYIYVFSDVFCWFEMPGNVSSDWKNTHCIVPARVIGIEAATFICHFIGNRQGAIVVDGGKVAGICIGFVIIMLVVFIQRMPRKVRTLNNILGLFLSVAMVCYPFVHGTLYAVSSPGSGCELEIVSSELRKDSDQNEMYYLTLKWEDGTVRKREVPGYVYRGYHLKDSILVQQCTSLLGIRFINFY